MNAHATAFQPDMSLGAFLAAIDGNDDVALLITYDGRVVQSGYHVTEVKAGSFSTLDCGGNPDAWQETVLQVEDLPADEGKPTMTAGKFRRILEQVDRKVYLAHEARLTIEIGRPGEAMRVFDVAGVDPEEGSAVVRLQPRSAICKPRHRAAEREAKSCCGPAVGCC